MKVIRYLSLLVGLLLTGCSLASTPTYLVAEGSGPDGRAVRLVERRQIRRETSLLTPEGPKWNREAASLSRYFLLSEKREVELPFLEAKDEYRPSVWALKQGLWLAHIIPVSGETELVLFDSAGEVRDRRAVRLPDGRAGGGTVRFDDHENQLIFEQKARLYHFAIRAGRIVWLEEAESDSKK